MLAEVKTNGGPSRTVLSAPTVNEPSLPALNDWPWLPSSLPDADAAVPLTSVRQPKYQLGRAAAELLLDEADRPDQHEHRRFVFKPELVARASSGAYLAATPGSPAFPE